MPSVYFYLAMFWTVVTLFGLSSFLLAIYGLHMYALMFLFRRRASGVRAIHRAIIEKYRASTADPDWPSVTVQIPIYNEADVARRIIRAVAALDYPRDRFEIQVLDDSTDHTRSIVDQAAAEAIEGGVNVKVVRRTSREGYKAGALEFGLKQASGEYVGVFDADFVPDAAFLRSTIPLIEHDPGLACIQARWGHLNRTESWLTEAQSLGIDGHFVIEQGARAWNGLMMNFNGTAGVWRRAAIDDPKVGGWSGDTLTEDLDLSYRAQLAGWRIDYCFDVVCPAEVPGTMTALKSQQRRWATGSIQVACKLLPRVWWSEMPLIKKFEATVHLTQYSVAIWMLLLALLARPMVGIVASGLIFPEWFWIVWSVTFIAAIAPSTTYAYSRYCVEGRWGVWKNLLWLLLLGCGLCVNNALAVVRGLTARGGEFVRTPKSGSRDAAVRQSTYGAVHSRLWMFELAMCGYSLFSVLAYAVQGHVGSGAFLLVYAIGFGMVGWMSKPERAFDQGDAADTESSPMPSTMLPPTYAQPESAGAR